MDQVQTVVQLYREGKILREIAQVVFAAKSINRVITILEAHPESGYVRGRRTTRRHKYFFNESFFAIIDTEAKAYLFGFVAADGWIKYMNGNPMAVCLEIHYKDREILEAWQRLMGEKSPPIVERTQKDGSHKVRIVFHSAKMARDLERLGIGKDKTNKLGDITCFVPNLLMRHFVRGVCDGDGCAVVEKSRLRISFRGTKIFLEALQRVIPEPMQLIEGNQKWPSLHTNTHRAGCRLSKWMYDEATILLNRKWEKCKSGFALRWAMKNSEYR